MASNCSNMVDQKKNRDLEMEEPLEKLKYFIDYSEG